MKLHPRVTRSVLELVKRFEGLRRQAARLPDGGWTVGYGHTRSAREGAVVTPEDADALLYYDLSEVAEKVEAWTFTPLNQNQFEALTAFAFNIGVDNFRRSTVLKRVNEGQHLMAAAALELWRKSDFGGEDLVIDALVRRRAAEKAHYLTPPEGFRPSPTPVLKPVFDHSVIEEAANSRAGRNAAVVNASLDGDQATATIEPPLDAEDIRQAGFPYVAATGLATARLHQLFPEKTVEPDADPQSPIAPHAMQSEDETSDRPASVTANDHGFSDQTQPEPETKEPLSLEVPPAPREAPAFTTAFDGFAPPPVRQFDAVQSAAPLDTPPMAGINTPHVAVEEQQVSKPGPDRASLFDKPSPPPALVALEGAGAMQLWNEGIIDHKKHDGSHNHDSAAEIVNGHAPGPIHNRSVIYFSIGLLGVALFAAALFSMFSGKASPVNLVIGLMGILLMTPAGGYFLWSFLNKRDALVEL